MSLKLTELKCDYRRNPIGIDSIAPVFSWIIESNKKNVMQASYKIVVKQGDNIVWDSGKIESEQSAFVAYAGTPLISMTEYEWNIIVFDNTGEYAMGMGTFETALMNREDWTAKWVEPIQKPAFIEPPRISMELGFCNVDVDDIKMEPAQMIRREFFLKKPIEKARVYATAHGIYFLELNGNRVGNIQLAPGHTSYYAYLEYQTYDITKDLHQGKNAIGMVIGDGWYRGKVGISGQSCQYGDKVVGLFQIEVEYKDGTRETIISDEACTSQAGPIDYADLYVGQRYDANKEQIGFSKAGFPEKGWKPVDVKNYGYEVLRAEYGDPVRVVDIIKPLRVWTTPKGEIMIDAGQVLAGHVRMRVQGEKGAKVVLEHTEVLDTEGNYLCNIIGSFVNQTDTYILKGEGIEVFEPEFTFHGFRYIRVTGYPGMPTVDDFDILVIASDMEKTGEFVCSDERLNQLQHNIFWSLKSNMISIPTDCPQREKAGWTGDAQIIAPTACYNMDALAFFKRWLRIVAKDQTEDGQIPNIVPYLKAYRPDGIVPNNTDCSAGWGDVAVIMPWSMYEVYGDETILSDNYEMMKKWIDYIRYTAEHEMPKEYKGEMTPERREWNKYLWNTNFHFGDWLTPSVSFDFETGDVDMIQSAFKTMDIIPSVFYAYSTDIMKKTAKVLKNEMDEMYYSDLHEKVTDAFIKEYVDENGYIATKLQGIYVLALQMRLVPEELRSNMFNKLLEMIAANGGKLDTGFLSVSFLLDVLKDEGNAKAAYDMLFVDECPSWLYEVKMGATTIWEAWQAILPDGTPTSVSYNHYAFGCVGDWMYRNIAGIDKAESGYKKAKIKPLMDRRITSATGSFKTPYGILRNEWKQEDGMMTVKTNVPCNTTADIYLPQDNGTYKVEYVGSGSYEFSYPYVV